MKESEEAAVARIASLMTGGGGNGDGKPPRELITPGLPFAPTFIPYCSFCDLPVEVYVIETPREFHRIAIDAECCGVHQGAYVSTEEVLRAMQSGAKYYVTVRPGQYPGYGTESRRPK